MAAFGAIGAWEEDKVIEPISYGVLLRPIDPDAFAPVLRAPLAVRSPSGKHLGTLRVGTPVSVQEDGSLRVSLGQLSVAVASSEAPVLGRTFAAQPEPAQEGQSVCLPAGASLRDAPSGTEIARNQTESCLPDWRVLQEGDGGWAQVRHPETGLEGWMAPEHLDGGFGYHGLLTGGTGLYGGSDVHKKTISTPRFVYASPNEAVVGYLLAGTYIVDEARPDGWWRADLVADSGTVAVWFPPDPPAEAEPPEREGVGGCASAPAALGGLWLAGLAGVLRRTARSGRRTGDPRR